MSQTAVAAPEEQDFILSSLSPSPAQKRLALGVVVFLAVAFVIVAGPLSSLQLPKVQAFIPIYATATFLIDAITAILLFAQFSILRSRALLALSSGYLFSALMVVPWLLTFPGVFAPAGLLNAGVQSTAWLYNFWHAGFPAFVIAYAVMKDGDAPWRSWPGSVRVAVSSAVAFTVAAVCAAAILATAGEDLLPILITVDNVHLTPLWAYAAGFTSLAIVLAIAMLWLRRRSTLDLWLMAVMFACLVEIGMISFPVAARYTPGWYAGRICGVVSASLLLFILLHEIRTVYARLQNARLHSELQRSEAFLAEAQSISSTGSIGWDVPSGEFHWSDETYKIFGHDRSVKPTLELMLQRIHPDDRDLAQRSFARACREGSNFDFEHRLLMPDDSVRHLHVQARALRPSLDNLEFVGAVTDVTGRKQAEEERVRLEQRLRQAEKMEAVGRLAGGIAHDFNNVLSGILGYGETLVEETPADSPLRRYSQNVLTAANRGRALVEQILVYSRSQRGKRVPVDIAVVVAETLELVRGTLPANIHLDLRLAQSPLVVIGDPTQMHQVVMNVSTNAVHAMGKGGVLHVALDAAELPDARSLSHGSLGPGRYGCLSVADQGTGMDETTLSRIFEPFFTTKEVGRGTGLGLSIVYAIVTDSGGAIDVKSAIMQGSTFNIYLPLENSAARGDAGNPSVSLMRTGSA